MTKRLIGLTGGIATGKSTVANYLATAYNLPILDADVYARDAVSVRSPILSQIAQRYGKSEILLADGNLNRAKLGEIIFHQPEERI
ncbi:dephospho-CoA kinase [Sphaerospermopsis reniformis]|uniref:Dephospho-CoA kinase n=1 Tax=Sphaerospermopsis reniformis TaxID=531300 RepID=A0A480A3Q1_9CYAN|nr:dephospho-CoA kinase [Sphaerospermopsis reniformis]